MSANSSGGGLGNFFDVLPYVTVDGRELCEAVVVAEGGEDVDHHLLRNAPQVVQANVLKHSFNQSINLYASTPAV